MVIGAAKTVKEHCEKENEERTTEAQRTQRKKHREE
jgi:hypothetical protein